MKLTDCESEKKKHSGGRRRVHNAGIFDCLYETVANFFDNSNTLDSAITLNCRSVLVCRSIILPTAATCATNPLLGGGGDKKSMKAALILAAVLAVALSSVGVAYASDFTITTDKPTYAADVKSIQISGTINNDEASYLSIDVYKPSTKWAGSFSPDIVDGTFSFTLKTNKLTEHGTYTITATPRDISHGVLRTPLNSIITTSTTFVLEGPTAPTSDPNDAKQIEKLEKRNDKLKQHNDKLKSEKKKKSATIEEKSAMIEFLQDEAEAQEMKITKLNQMVSVLQKNPSSAEFMEVKKEASDITAILLKGMEPAPALVSLLNVTSNPHVIAQLIPLQGKSYNTDVEPESDKMYHPVNIASAFCPDIYSGEPCLAEYDKDIELNRGAMVKFGAPDNADLTIHIFDAQAILYSLDMTRENPQIPVLSASHIFDVPGIYVYKIVQHPEQWGFITIHDAPTLYTQHTVPIGVGPTCEGGNPIWKTFLKSYTTDTHFVIQTRNATDVDVDDVVFSFRGGIPGIGLRYHVLGDTTQDANGYITSKIPIEVYTKYADSTRNMRNTFHLDSSAVDKARIYADDGIGSNLRYMTSDKINGTISHVYLPDSVFGTYFEQNNKKMNIPKGSYIPSNDTVKLTEEVSCLYGHAYGRGIDMRVTSDTITTSDGSIDLGPLVERAKAVPLYDKTLHPKFPLIITNQDDTVSDSNGIIQYYRDEANVPSSYQFESTGVYYVYHGSTQLAKIVYE